MSDFKSYCEKLKDPRWQRLSAEVKERAEWKCERCGSASKTLHAHHMVYEKGLEPWEYHPSYFECLCWSCHERVEMLLRKLRWAVCDMHADDIASIIKIATRPKWRRTPMSKARLKELKKWL